MFRKRLAFVLTFMMILATISSSVYAGEQDLKDNKVNEEPVVIIGVSESKLKDKYGDLSEEEIQNILNTGSELVFENIENKENNLKLLKSENKYLDMFDIQISNSSNDKEILSDNTISPYASDTKPFSDTMHYVVRSTEGTGNYSISASGTILNGRTPSIERASGRQRSGANLGSPKPTFTKGGSTMWVLLRVKIVGFGINTAGYIYMK